MRLIILLAVSSMLSACVVYGDSYETGIITPIGSVSTDDARDDPETEY